MTLHRYVLRAQPREAALRLRTRDESMLGIARGSGFGDRSSVIHAFRAECGVEPARLRDGLGRR